MYSLAIYENNKKFLKIPKLLKFCNQMYRLANKTKKLKVPEIPEIPEILLHFTDHTSEFTENFQLNV